MNSPRILFSMPTRHHVEIALDELEGLHELGFVCGQFPYAAKEGVESKLGRMRVIVQNAYNLVKISRHFKPDIIYFNSRVEVLAGIRDYLTILIFKTLYRKPVRFLLKSHGSDLDVFESKSTFMGKLVIPFLKKNIAGWLFLSSEEKNIVIKNGYLPANKAFVTKNIVRTQQFVTNKHFKSRLNIADDCKTLLYVGRLIKEKGIYEVVEAFTQIEDSYKAKLIVVGWGAELDNVKQLSKKLGIADHIIFTGFIPEQDVIEYYANCDMLVFPTFFPEGFPMALFNSVAAGLPVITTPTRAATDYLSEPENCLWVKPQNSNSVAHALTTLLSSESLITQMRQNNLLKGSLFSKKQVSVELAAIINLVMLT